MTEDDIATWAPPWIEKRSTKEGALHEALTLCFAAGDSQGARDAWRRHTGEEQGGDYLAHLVERMGPHPPG